MDIHQQLLDDMKQAMRDKDMVRLGVIRLLRSEVQNYEIDHGKQTDEGVQKLIVSMVKKLTDAVTEFAAAGRDDIVADEQAKLTILQTYLPKQLSDDELQLVIDRVAQSSGETHMGKLIGLVTKEVGSSADGSRVAALIKSRQ